MTRPADASGRAGEGERPFMHHLKSPPIEPLHQVVGALERGGLVCALGGSGLLAALGLAIEVNDWDLTTDAPPERVREALRGFATVWCGSSGIHADQKLMLPAQRVECIIGFAFHSEAGVTRIPTQVASRWRDVPVGSPESWAAAYALLGREAKALLLFDWLERQGAEAARVAALLSQPLPGSLAERLRALPVRRPSSST